MLKFVTCELTPTFDIFSFHKHMNWLEFLANTKGIII